MDYFQVIIWSHQPALFNITKVKLELSSDPDMCEKDMGDGLSYISNKYSNANNKYLKSYDSKREWKQIIYLDENNLYNYTMSKFLPTSRFKRIDPKGFDLNKCNSNGLKWFLLKVDLEYSK